MAEPVLSARHLAVSFGALRAADDVSLDLLPGEIHALIGPNGAGKSTLIRLLAGELAAGAGRVVFLGRDVTRLDLAGRARMGLARTYQVSSVAPDFTVLQNVILAGQGASGRTFRFFRPALSDRIAREDAARHIDQAGLEGREAVRAAALSHGERRKLEIAMALALSPRAFLLDEPMAGMGADGAAQLGRMLSDLRRKAPILLVEHDMDAVFALSDRISVLAGGRLIATGSADEIRADAQVREVYLGHPA